MPVAPKCVVLIALVLAGCGGGGGGGGSPAPSVSPVIQNADPGGIWRGTFSSTVTNQTVNILGVVTQAGAVRFVNIDEGSQFFGQINVSGNSFSGTLTAVSLAGFQFVNGSSSGTVSINGMVSSRSQFSGSFDGLGDSGSFQFSYDPLYERSSSLARLSGNWSAIGELLFKLGTNGNISGTVGLSIGDDGVLRAGDTDHCDYDGSVSVLDPSFNVYDVQISIADCGILNGQYQGFSVLSDTTATDDTLTIAVTNSAISIPGELMRFAQVSESGIWNGSLVSPITGVLQVLGLISEDGEMRFFNEFGAQIAGNAEVNGSLLMAEMLAFAPAGEVFPDGTNVGLVDVRGVISEQTVLDGTFFGVGDLGSFSLAYDSIYERDSSLDRLAGTWLLSDGATGFTLLELNVDASGGFDLNIFGEIQGADFSGCEFDGIFSLIDTDFNAYRASVDVTLCGIFDGVYGGLVTLTDSGALNNTLVLGISNTAFSVTGFLIKQPVLSTLDMDPSVFASGVDVSLAYPNAALSTAHVSAEINDLDVVTPLSIISNNSGPVFTDGNVFLTDSGSGSWSADVRLGDDALRVDFQLPTTAVSATIIPNDTDTGVMQIYDDQSQLLGETIARSGGSFTLTLNAPANTNIAFALVAPIDGAAIGLIQASVALP